ncbi:MAG: hypothetical protein LBS60_15735 [Deltaproteobacteria bacterium]|jgi:uncharacterized protein (DUF1330 family)|nr:hypothetical protein [Deltaproteobacteria bacterium]
MEDPKEPVTLEKENQPKKSNNISTVIRGVIIIALLVSFFYIKMNEMYERKDNESLQRQIKKTNKILTDYDVDKDNYMDYVRNPPTRFGPRVTPSITKKTPSTNVRSLFADYRKDLKAAKEKYGKKWVIISGKLVSVESTKGGHNLLIAGIDYVDKMTVFIENERLSNPVSVLKIENLVSVVCEKLEYDPGKAATAPATGPEATAPATGLETTGVNVASPNEPQNTPSQTDTIKTQHCVVYAFQSADDPEKVYMRTEFSP